MQLRPERTLAINPHACVFELVIKCTLALYNQRAGGSFCGSAALLVFEAPVCRPPITRLSQNHTNTSLSWSTQKN